MRAPAVQFAAERNLLESRMIDQAKKQLLRGKLRNLAFQATMGAMAALFVAPALLRAEDAPLARSESAASSHPKEKAAEYTVNIDNSDGPHKLQFDREKSECMLDSGPASFTVAPGETKTFWITDQNTAATVCFGGAKLVVWQVNSYGADGGTVYTIDFLHRNNGFFFSRWQTSINTKTGHPGMPSAATCGALACLNQWADQDGNSSITITFH
jgi:hypothetical protein